MNKHIKISLLVLVTIVLLLAIAIPALAREQKETSCSLEWLAHYEKDGNDIEVKILADEGTLAFEENIATQTCKGSIPLGGTRYNPMVVYFTLDEMREYLCQTYGKNDPEEPACNIGTPFKIGPAEYGDQQNLMIYKGEELDSSTWSLVVKPNGDYILVSEYTLEFP